MAETEAVLRRTVFRIHPTVIVDAALFAALVMPLLIGFSAAHLPLRIDLSAFVGAYWGATGVQSVFAAVILSVAGLQLEQTIRPMLRRYWEQRLRFLFVAVLCVWMFWQFGVWLGMAVVVDALALAELLDRRKQHFGVSLLDVFVPAVYLFIGVLLVYMLNHVIAGIKFAGLNDGEFEKADLILFRTNVAALSHWMAAHFPESFFGVMEMVYSTLYAQIGAAIVITALLAGRRYALLYVRTLVTAYLIALVCFYLWPTMGAFFLYSPAERHYLLSLPTYWTQEAIVAKAQLLKAHNLIPEVATVNLADYYIGFPSMHIAMPLIAIWFLRKWRGVAVILLCFDVLLVISIVALQWHYLVDIVGGALVAGLAILINRKFDAHAGEGNAADVS